MKMEGANNGGEKGSILLLVIILFLVIRTVADYLLVFEYTSSSSGNNTNIIVLEGNKKEHNELISHICKKGMDSILSKEIDNRFVEKGINKVFGTNNFSSLPNASVVKSTSEMLGNSMCKYVVKLDDNEIYSFHVEMAHKSDWIALYKVYAFEEIVTTGGI